MSNKLATVTAASFNILMMNQAHIRSKDILNENGINKAILLLNQLVNLILTMDRKNKIETCHSVHSLEIK